jgi:hypothetical protein
MIPIEVKLSATPQPAMAATIKPFQKDIGGNAAPGYVVLADRGDRQEKLKRVVRQGAETELPTHRDSSARRRLPKRSPSAENYLFSSSLQRPRLPEAPLFTSQKRLNCYPLRLDSAHDDMVRRSRRIHKVIFLVFSLTRGKYNV